MSTLVVISITMLLFESKQKILEQSQKLQFSNVTPFPVGVDTVKKNIEEQSGVEFYRKNYLTGLHPNKDNLFYRIWSKLAENSWIQNLASLSSRTLLIFPGERKEEIAIKIAKILNWDDSLQTTFIEKMKNIYPNLPEGTYLPGVYVISTEATATTVAQLLADAFEREVIDRYTDEVSEKIPLTETIIVASLLEREAYKFEDMRIISGVIWNRLLFKDMKLQIDATLQYAKGTSKGPFWSVPKPADKNIDSPYNTYKNKGLPPTAISNPSLSAILASLNPSKTDCLFYFHHSGKLYCNVTYEGHVRQLKSIFGQGR